MAVVLPPDVDTLRRLVRGQLSRDDRQRVDRWLGRCVDPALTRVLSGLIVEWREEQRDAELSGAARRLSALWAPLYRQARAFVDVIASPLEPVPGLLGPAAGSGEGIVLVHDTRDDATVAATVVVAAPAARVLLVASNDVGEVHVLLDRALSGVPPWRIEAPQRYRVEAHEGRVTFWMMVAGEGALLADVATSPDALIAGIEALEVSPSSRVLAARVSGPETIAD